MNQDLSDPCESSETRERRHAAISILNDPELLLFHALASNEVCTVDTYSHPLPLPLLHFSLAQSHMNRAEPIQRP